LLITEPKPLLKKQIPMRSPSGFWTIWIKIF